MVGVKVRVRVRVMNSVSKFCYVYVVVDRGNRKCQSRDVVSVLNVSVSSRSRDVFWNVSSRLGLVLVSRVWKNRTSRSHLGLEDITSRSRSGDFSLVNIHAMHQVSDISGR